MTRPSILEKLDQELRLEITTESQVVYILAEIRKAIEHANEVTEYFALDFYCSFALHTVMNRAGAHRIMQRMDAAHPFLVRGETLPRDLGREIHETTILAKFRAEMKKFIVTNNLPDRLISHPDAWSRFLHLYGKVIHDCKLTLRPDFTPLKNIDRVVFSVEEATVPCEGFPDQVMFVLRWTCFGKDGTSGSHESFSAYDTQLEE